jgi:hypothetical protein
MNDDFAFNVATIALYAWGFFLLAWAFLTSGKKDGS